MSNVAVQCHLWRWERMINITHSDYFNNWGHGKNDKAFFAPPPLIGKIEQTRDGGVQGQMSPWRLVELQPAHVFDVTQHRGVPDSVPNLWANLHRCYFDFINFRTQYNSRGISKSQQIWLVCLRYPLPLALLHVLWQDSKSEWWVRSSWMKTNEMTQLSNNINPTINLYTVDNLTCIALFCVVIACCFWWTACEWNSNSRVWMVVVCEVRICSIALGR